MKQIISALPIVFLFLAMLFSPKAVFEGAESGLLLWFQIVFPTLFPFMLISGLMLAGGGINIIARLQKSQLFTDRSDHLSPFIYLKLRKKRKHALFHHSQFPAAGIGSSG